MNIKLKKRNKKILFKWILTGIIIFMIPFISIIINFFFSRSIIISQINNTNNTVLANIRYSIDNKLQNIKNLNHLLLLDNNLNNMVNSYDDNTFWNEAQNCYNELNNYNFVYSDLNILIYIPIRNYLISNGIANSPASIYNTLTYSSKPSITLEEWMNSVSGNYSKEHYFISSYCSYRNFGEDSFVYACTSPFVYKQESKFNILTSIPTSFINSYLDEAKNSTFLILNQDGCLLKQFGTYRESFEKYQFSLNNDDRFININIDGTDYICSKIKSKETAWTYVICTPSFLFLRDSILLKNITLVSIILSLLVGISIIIFTQRRNYRPVNKMMDYIPASMKLPSNNEFELLEKYQLALNDENSVMREKIHCISENAKEIYLYSQLKGANFHMGENDITKTLELEFTNKKFVIVSIYIDNRCFNPEDYIENFNLLSFAIYNVANDIFESKLIYEKIIDGFFNVFLFVLDDNNINEWDDNYYNYFHKLYDFFLEQFKIDLYITIGDVFENLEQTSTCYINILDVFEYRYVLNQSGVLTVSELKNLNINSIERLKQYTHQINLAIIQKNTILALESAQLYMKELYKHNFPQIINQYHVYSLINSLIIDMNHIMNQAQRYYLENQLETLLHCKTLDELQIKVNNLLHFLCGDTSKYISDGSNDESRLVKKIKAYVDNHYADCNLNIASIANAIDLTPKYMSKLFKEDTQEGLLDFINNVRINHAKDLLKNTGINIDELSVMVGFSNSRSFRRNFHKATGVTPKDYRNHSKT